MAIDATHRMNVVRTIDVGKGCIHLCHIKLTVRNGRMAILAALFGFVAVLIVAREAAEALVNAARGPVVAGAGLVEGIGCMTLKTISLKRIVREFNLPLSIPNCRRGQIGKLDMCLLVPVIEQSFGKTRLSVVKYLFGIGVVSRNLRHPLAVDFVTGKTRDHRLGRFLR